MFANSYIYTTLIGNPDKWSKLSWEVFFNAHDILSLGSFVTFARLICVFPFVLFSHRSRRRATRAKPLRLAAGRHHVIENGPAICTKR